VVVVVTSPSARTTCFALALVGLLPSCASSPWARGPLRDDVADLDAGSAIVIDAASAEARPLAELAGDALFTVVTFFSATCPCQAAHDARLRALFDRYRDRGVRFVAVASELDATPERARAEARRRGYTFPIVIDRGGALAARLGAEFATYTVIVDRRGHVRYRGGLDSDRTHLRDDAEHYARDAIDALVAGHEPKVVEAKALGCALRTS
jgi:hypothetical protein